MRRVLVVEDEEDIRESLAEILGDAGYVVSTAANGVEALDVLRGRGTACVILLDLMMPVMDGVQFRQEQSKDPALAAIPIVLVSGASDVGNKAADLKAAAYLLKPFALDELLSCVRRFC